MSMLACIYSHCIHLNFLLDFGSFGLQVFLLCRQWFERRYVFADLSSTTLHTQHEGTLLRLGTARITLCQ